MAAAIISMTKRIASGFCLGKRKGGGGGLRCPLASNESKRWALRVNENVGCFRADLLGLITGKRADVGVIFDLDSQCR